MPNKANSSANENTDSVRIVDPNLKFGFVQVPRPILKARDLSDKAKIVYALLLDYAWQKGSCFPGQGRLAEDLQTTERTIQRALSELREYGLIIWQRRGLTKTNIYFILSLAGNPNLDLSEDEQLCPVPAPGRHRGRPLPDETPGLDVMADDPVRQGSGVGQNADAPKASRQDGTKMSQPEATPRSHEEYADQNTQNVLNNSKFRMSTARYDYDNDREVILHYIGDVAAEFADRASLRSSTTRACNLYERSGLSLDDFIAKLYEARAITKERTGMIRTTSKDPKKAFPTKHKMAYFFACLEEKMTESARSPSPFRKGRG